MKKHNGILKKILLNFVLVSIVTFNLTAQTGPGGVGNSDGSNGQPENVIWFDASSLSLSDLNPVATWTDLSGNGNDATQSTSTAQPLYRTAQLNGLPAVVFDGTDDYMPFDGNLIVNSDYTLIVVAQRRTNRYRRIIIGGSTSSANQNLHVYWENSSNFRAHHYGNDLSTPMILTTQPDSAGTDPNVYGIFSTLLSSGDATNQRRNYQNNQYLGSRSNSAQLSSYNGSAIARYAALNEFHDIDVAELIIFSNALNDAQLQIVHQYLNVKYNIRIANDFFDPDVSFVTDVVGIGETNNEEHSEAVSAGLYLTALGGLNNNDYIFASHNNLTNNSSNFRTGTEVTNAGADSAYNRLWYIDTQGTPEAQLAFDFSEALDDGLNPTNISNYVLLYRAGTTGDFTKVKNADGLKNGDQVYFNLTSADINTGYYTLGTEDATNSPLEGVPGRTWYTLISGNWGDWEIWTLDPSGSLPNNPDQLTPDKSPTSTADKVVIKTGRTVEVDTINNLAHSSITIEGRLDLTNTTNHSFGEIRGTGRVLLAADNFPSGDASHFYSKGQGEGTVEYYGGSYELSTAREFFDVEVILDNPGNTITLTNDYNINGNLTITTGGVQFNDGTDDRIVNLTVDGDVLVESDGKISVGTGNTFALGNYQIGTGVMPEDDGLDYHDVFHQFTIYGNFTNRGSVRFTNLNAPDYNSMATDGAVTVRFKGASNSEINLYNTTDFYNLVIDKGTDKTYKANLYSDNVNYFRIFGANSVGRRENAPYSAEDPQIRKALFIYHGTLQLRGNIYIPTLSEGSQEGGNGDYAVGKNARLWMDGSNVTVYSTASNVSQITGFTATDTYTADGVQTNSSNQAMSVYGEFKISNGYFGTRNSAGFIFWAAGNPQVKIEGGTCNVAQMRSAGGGGGIASYTQTGGTILARGNETEAGEYTGDYPLFGLEGTDAVFQMTGGEIILQDYDNDNDPEFSIESSEGNYKVTGGKLTINIREASAGAGTQKLQILSTANLWNLEIDNSNGSGNVIIELDTTLKVSNNLTLNPYCTLEVNDPNTGIDHDVYIGRNFSILEDGTTTNTGIYNFQNNTTVFDGKEDGEFYIGWNHNDGYEQHLWNLTVNKSEGKRLTIKGDPNKDPDIVSSEFENRLVQVENDANIISGILDQGRQSVRLFGGVNLKKKGQLGVYDVGVTPLTAYIMFRDGDLTIYSDPDAIFGNIKFNSTGTVTFTSDVYIKRIGYYQGLYNIGTYNLKVDYLHRNGTASQFAVNNGSATKMIYGDGNASDGGLTLLITGNGDYAYPIGTKTTLTRYTPAVMTISSFSDNGYVSITPVDQELRTIDKTGGDHLSYYWHVSHDGFATLPNVIYEMYYDESDIDGSTHENNFVPGRVLNENPFTRLRDNDKNKVDDGNNIIYFNDYDGANPDAPFAIENADYTSGTANCFLGTVPVFRSVATYVNWNVNSTWDQNKVPTSGSIVIIQNGNRIWGNNIPNLPGEVRFEHDYVTHPEPNSENVPRLQFNTAGTFDIGVVSGTGMVSFNTAVNPTVVGDFGSFAENEDAFFMYWNNGGATLTNIKQPAPSVMIEGGNCSINQSFTTNTDFIIQGGASVTVLQDVNVGRDLCPGAYSNGTLIFDATGNDVTMTVEGNVDYTYFPSRAAATTRRIQVENALSTLDHKLIVKGDIVLGDQNSSILDLYQASDRTKVILELQGETSNRFYKSDVSTVIPDFYRIIMNKGTSQDSTFTFENEFNLSGDADGNSNDKALYMLNGTLVLDDPNIDIDLSTGGQDFEIPSSSCLQITQGTANLYGDNTGIWLDGKLLIDGGTLDMVSGVGNGNNYIEYSSSGNAEIEISDGNLWVGSQIRRGLITEEGILTFYQSGGEILLGVNDGGDDERAIFEILNTGSSFTHVSGDFIFVNDYRGGASIASMYYDPEASNLSTGTSIQFGNGSTLSGSEQFSLYAGKALQNLTINSTNTPKLTLDVVPLTLNEDLTINLNSEFDANGLDLYLKGDMMVDVGGVFTSNKNDTYFLGTAAQQITGSPTFWNLYKTTSNQLSINKDVDVDNELSLNAGTFVDNDNTLSVQGAVNMDIVHAWGGSSNGIFMNGTSEQVLTGNGTFGKLSIKNSADISVPQGNVFTIDGALQLETGVLDIGKNLLILDEDAIIIEQNAFSDNNMIQTNISFTDAGVIKYFPVIIPTDNYSFIYPIGSEGKYSPVEMAIDDIDAGGSIRVKAANETHPTIINDTEPCNEITDTLNVLKYHWLLEANSVTGFNANANMKYYVEDYQENSAFYDVTDYIAARLLFGSTLWNKYDQASFDEGSTLLRFNFSNADDDAISGDYTAGVEDQDGTCEGAIPDEVPAYISIKNGNWTDPLTWDTYPTPGGTVPSNGPRGAVAIVEHEVTIPSNYILNYKTTINPTGVLKVGTTFGHRLGIVEGKGTLQLERGNLPAGIYDDFFSRSGGTIEFTGTTDYDVLSEVNNVYNLKFSGTGERRLPNLDFEVYGLFTIDGSDANLWVINEHDRDVTLDSNIVFNQGKFDAGIAPSTVILRGTHEQTISGTGSFTGTNAFRNVVINNSNGVTLAAPIEVDGTLAFTDGVITTTATNILTVDNASETAVTGYGNSNYVDGPMRKLINSGGDFVFPLGDNNRYGPMSVYNATNGSAAFWQAEYFNLPHASNSVTGSLIAVSIDEYWAIDNPNAGDAVEIELRWDSNSSITPLVTGDINEIVVAEFNGTNWAEKPSNNPSGDNYDGTVKTTAAINTDLIYYTLGSTITISAQAYFTTPNDVCENVSIPVSFSGVTASELNFTLYYSYNSGASSSVSVTALPYSLPTADGPGTYELTGFEYNSGGNTGVVDNTVVTVNAAPAQPAITPADLDPSLTFCAGGSVILTSSAGTGYLWSTGATTQNINVNTTGSYTVQVSNASGCYSLASNSKAVTVNPLPIVNPTATPATICFGETSQLNVGAGASYLWSPDVNLVGVGAETSQNPVFDPSQTGSNPTTATPVTTTFSVTVTDINGCSDTGTVDVNVYRLPETGPQYHIPNNF